MNRIVKLTLILFLLVGCKENKFEIYDPLIKEIKQNKVDLGQYDVIMLVPSEGCGGCINGAESFLVNSYDKASKKKMLFVVTGHSSKKTLRIRLGEKVLNNPDIIADYKHLFDKPPFMGDYPKVMYLENGNIVDVKDVDPGSSEEIYAGLEKMLEDK